jgi:hypothetical protein
MAVGRKIFCTVSRILKRYPSAREIGRSFGFPKLEDGLSILSKDELADSLAYNSIKV